MSEEKTPQPNFSIARIYTKDLSLESPKSPKIFESNWQPKLGLDVDVKHSVLNEGLFEVVLKLAVTVTTEDQTAFLIEVQQAGIFAIAGFDDATRDQILGAMCPNILFPYARETIDMLAVKASFPAPMLAPINFDAMLEARRQATLNG
ncbi:MAG: protein-export chaperone SecB [Litorivicinaceae bacterium]|jgi:preprotein translocase subunit SecB|nr:protein-export chaperone SecB [Litorivicinaceae bacterium]